MDEPTAVECRTRVSEYRDPSVFPRWVAQYLGEVLVRGDEAATFTSAHIRDPRIRSTAKGLLRYCPYVVTTLDEQRRERRR